MGTNNQNCRHYTSIHLVSEILLLSCLMPSEQRFSYIMVRTSYNLMRWCLLCSRPTRLVGFLQCQITEITVWNKACLSNLEHYAVCKNQFDSLCFNLTGAQTHDLPHHIMHYTLKHEAVENVPGVTDKYTMNKYLR